MTKQGIITIETDELSHNCKECGKTENGNWVTAVTEELRKTQLCFTCDFWHNIIKNKGSNSVIVKGTHYIIGRKPQPKEHKGLLGHGGALFKIRFFNGREVETNNLWCQGTVPDRFKDRLPDNAEFKV
jgi:hypothetical protein